MNTTFTVFTPIYNRANMVINLYNSLIRQEDKNFIWLIVDDGSTDDTKEVIEEFIKEGAIEISYYYQKNSGKYIAHNKAVILCKTELFVCVDSDDTLLPNAVKRSKEIWENVRENNKICGIVSPRKMNTPCLFKNTPEFGTLMNLYNNHSYKGETMLVYRSSILKRFLFPCISDEKFMQENVIYNRIDRCYFYKYENAFFYESEYQEDGLTRNMSSITLKNPISTLYSYKNTAVYQINITKKAKAFGCYLAFKKVFKVNENFPELKVIPIIQFMGWILKRHYLKKFSETK